jgi:hypothetical protein
VEPARREGDVNIPDLLRPGRVEELEEVRAAVTRLVAFFADGDTTKRDRVTLLLSLRP